MMKSVNQYSDEELIKKWPGFANKYATVNGIKLHYVEGGSGEPLICLPGWPQNRYSYHPIALCSKKPGCNRDIR